MSYLNTLLAVALLMIFSIVTRERWTTTFISTSVKASAKVISLSLTVALVKSGLSFKDISFQPPRLDVTLNPALSERISRLKGAVFTTYLPATNSSLVSISFQSSLLSV
jgi:hypothetical protein